MEIVELYTPDTCGGRKEEGNNASVFPAGFKS